LPSSHHTFACTWRLRRRRAMWECSAPDPLLPPARLATRLVPEAWHRRWFRRWRRQTCVDRQRGGWMRRRRLRGRGRRTRFDRERVVQPSSCSGARAQCGVGPIRCSRSSHPGHGSLDIMSVATMCIVYGGDSNNVIMDDLRSCVVCVCVCDCVCRACVCVCP
jgi:hypothetical protein